LPPHYQDLNPIDLVSPAKGYREKCGQLIERIEDNNTGITTPNDWENATACVEKIAGRRDYSR
jgi:hypothetical protein